MASQNLLLLKGNKQTIVNFILHHKTMLCPAKVAARLAFVAMKVGQFTTTIAKVPSVCGVSSVRIKEWSVCDNDSKKCHRFASFIGALRMGSRPWRHSMR